MLANMSKDVKRYLTPVPFWHLLSISMRGCGGVFWVRANEVQLVLLPDLQKRVLTFTQTSCYILLNS